MAWLLSSMRASQPSRRDRGRDRKRLVASLESLEGRALLASFVWNSLTSGDFNTPALWTGPNNSHTVPGPGDDATAPGGNYTITITSPTTVNSFNGGGSLTVATGGSFTVNNAVGLPNSTINNLTLDTGTTFTTAAQTTTLTNYAQLMGTLNVLSGATLSFSGFGPGINVDAGTALTGSGTFSVSSGVILNTPITAPQHLTIDSGTNSGISGTGTLTVPSGATLDWRSGFMSGTGGATDIAQGGTLLVEGTNTKTLQDRALANAGSATWTGTGNWDVEGNALFTNSGTLAIQNDATLTGTGSITNTGTITKTSLLGANGTTTISTSTLSNQGGISIASGQLLLDVIGTSTGNFDTAGAATLGLTQSWNLNAGTTLTNAGTVEIGNGVSGYGTINVNTNISASNFTLPGGDLVIAPSTTLTLSILRWSGGEISGAGTVGIPFNSAVLISGASDKTLSQATLSNSGIVNWLGTGNINLNSSAVISNNANATFNATNNQTIGGGPGGTFKNSGMFFKYSGVGTTTITPAITNLPGGLFVLDSGDVSISSIVNTGTIDLAPQTILNLTGTYTQPSGGTLEIEIGGGPLIYQYGQVTVAGTASLNGTLTVLRDNGFIPTVGQVTPIVTYASSTGNFSTINLPSSGLAPLYTTSQLATQYDVTAVSVPLPAAPTGLAIFPADDTNGPGVTTVLQPRLTGHAQPGLLVQIYDAHINLIASAIADAQGNFVATPISPFALGTYVLRAIAIDAVGHYGAAGAPFTLSIIQTPAAPTGLAIYPPDDTGGPGVTAIHSPRLTGQAQAGLLVQVYDASIHLIATGITNAQGTFIATTINPLAPGTYILRAIAIDSFGRYGAAGAPFTLTITPPPAAPTGLAIYPPDDTGGPGMTSNLQPRLTGLSQAGLLIQIYDSSTHFIGTAIVMSDGTFIVTPFTRFTIGVHILRAIAIDAGGNYGAAGAPFTLTIT